MYWGLDMKPPSSAYWVYVVWVLLEFSIPFRVTLLCYEEKCREIPWLQKQVNTCGMVRSTTLLSNFRLC